jgi:hypothetical protein
MGSTTGEAKRDDGDTRIRQRAYERQLPPRSTRKQGQRG